jgi:hypothetical protein
MIRATARFLHRVIAPGASWYYDPRQRQTGLNRPLKLQQNSHFQREPASISRDGDPPIEPRASESGQTLRTHQLAAL